MRAPEAMFYSEFPCSHVLVFCKALFYNKRVFDDIIVLTNVACDSVGIKDRSQGVSVIQLRPNRRCQYSPEVCDRNYEHFTMFRNVIADSWEAD